MINIAVLGFGVVGSGVVEVIDGGGPSEKAGDAITVKRILDLRDFDDTRVTNDYSNIVNDPEISIIVEAMGGLDPAFEYTKQAFMSGKYVVTSNKELVATHGAELIALARENGVCYMFEASVGGGIPIIRPLIQCLAADEITEITGILNGTTNYILSKMIHRGMSFEDALAKAQEKGYAERNPAADIEGHDSCRKIAILSSLCFGKQADYKTIPTEGITSITLEQVEEAAKEGYVIKLIASSHKESDGTITTKVAPTRLPKDHPLAGVEGVFNAILVTGSVTGDVMFYGRGAGKLPTASAVVADIVDIIRNGSHNAPWWE